jgi:hypothetical protein
MWTRRAFQLGQDDGPDRLLTASVLAERQGRLPTWAQLSILAAAVLLSPALALLIAIAVEIVIGVLVDTGVPALPAFAASGVIGWLLLRKLRRRRGAHQSRHNEVH